MTADLHEHHRDGVKLPAAPDNTPTVSQLFTGFLVLGLTGFGGVLPLARRMLVEKKRWLSPDEFTDLLGLCQFVPGGNIINLSVAVGLRLRGPVGALASIVGLIAVPTVIVVSLGSIYDRFGDDPHVRQLFAGLAAAAAGLLAVMAIRIAAPLRRSPFAIGIAAACFVAVAAIRMPLPWVMLVMAPLSIGLAWRLRR